MSDCHYRKEALNFYDKVDDLERENIPPPKKNQKGSNYLFYQVQIRLQSDFWGGVAAVQLAECRLMSRRLECVLHCHCDTSGTTHTCKY